jgi:cutinase
MKSAAGYAVNSRPRALRPHAAATLSAAALMGPQAVGFASAAPDPAAAPGSFCADIEVVFARGSFEAPGVGDTGQALVDALNSRPAGQTVNVYGFVRRPYRLSGLR